MNEQGANYSAHIGLVYSLVRKFQKPPSSIDMIILDTLRRHWRHMMVFVRSFIGSWLFRNSPIHISPTQLVVNSENRHSDYNDKIQDKRLVSAIVVEVCVVDRMFKEVCFVLYPSALSNHRLRV